MKFVPDRTAPSRIKRSPMWARYVLGVANAVARSAVIVFEGQGPHPYSNAPEHYAEMISGELADENGVIAGRAVAHASYSWWIEVGTSDTPRFAPLQQGADAIGLRIEAKPHG